MQTQSRIPKLKEVSSNGASIWFSELQRQGLLFHPEDDPADIIRVSDGAKSFSDREVTELRFLLDELETSIGHDQMVEAAYPVFMKACGIQLDA